MQHDRKKRWMTKPHKEHSPCSETPSFCMMYFFTFYTQFLSGWWTVLRELTKKSVFYSFGNHPLTDSTKSGEETNVTDHVLILATTSWVIHSCAFLFVLCIFFNELVWLTVGRSCTEVWEFVLPQTPWSSFPELLFFYCKTFFFFFFLFTAKAYLISVPPQTPYLLPAPLYLLHAVVR